MLTDVRIGERPRRGVGLAAAAALTIAWVVIRLVIFDTTLFPLTYTLPLLIIVWTRDRVALYAMAAVFIAAHLAKVTWLLPPGVLTGAELWANVVATFANITVGAVAVHAIVNLRERLERSLRAVAAQADELRAQGEELAQQNEELADQTEELSHQTEELAQQGEELASQNEELQAQTEEIGALNVALERRERLLEALFETARASAGEHAALQHIAAAGADLFADLSAIAVVYDAAERRTVAWAAADADHGLPLPAHDGLVPLVVAERRTAALDDLSLRPDVTVPAVAGLPPVRSALCAPILIDGAADGAFAIYGARPHAWTTEHFRLIEWLAAQSARVLQTLRAQSDLRDADRRKSEFLATLSHELRNPLSPMLYALKLLEQGETQGGQVLAILQRQFKQLTRLVDDVLDATRLSSNKVQVRRARLDLVPVVRDAIEAARPAIDGARHELRRSLPEHPVWLDADADRIAQVVANLLNNAVRYTPAGGRLAVTVAVEDGEAVLTVADTGVGLQAEDRQRVFDMFTQVGGPGSGGLGIGLAIVKGIVDLHGGRVDVTSDGIGRGSTFRIALPLAVAPADLAAPADAGPATSGRRVLVVDDNVDAAATLALLLEAYGHTVWIAHNGQAALDAACTSGPDVALLDIGLPDFDGYELARRLRQHDRTRAMRLVAVTGWGQEDDRARARDAGFDAHLTKPAHPDAVLAVL